MPTIDIDKPIADPVSRTQVETLRRNCDEFGVRLYPMGDIEQGIVHVVGPQLGLTQPGMTIVCGDSHTSTHGAFGALAMGIGTSEVEHVLATQTLPLRPFKTMAVNVDGPLPDRRDGQGHHPRADREDRHRRRAGSCHRIPGQCHRIAVHGRPDDGLQHEHRSRRPGGHGGAGRDHLRIPARPPARADRRAMGCRGAVLAAAAHRRRRRLRHRGLSRRGLVEPVRHLGNQPRPGGAAGRGRAGSRTDDRRRRAAGRRESLGVHGPSTRARRCATSRSTPCSSVLVPTVASRICGRWPTCCVAARWPRACGCWSFRARCGCARRPKPKGWARFSPPRAPNGVRPAARCAWA